MYTLYRWAVAALLAATPFVVFARDYRAEVAAVPERAGGVYYAYPGPDADYGRDTPKGYEAFYLSHYGRHGSRYLISDDDYKRVIDRLADASRAGALTATGERLRLSLDTVWAEARGRGGELTPLGARQHRGIARRMASAHPGVIAPGAKITAASTPVMRCAHSMFAFTEGLKELNPALDIPLESSERNMVYLNYHSPESGQYCGPRAPYYQDYKRFKAANTKSDRLISSIFADKAYTDRWVDRDAFMWDLYWIAVDLQNMETDVDLLPLFTNDELFNLWQTVNFEFYATNSSYPPARGLHIGNARNLVRHILDNADSYISSGEHGATLRFGHDGNIIPLAALLHIADAYSEAERPAELASDYATFHISPMASNLQMIFFRNPSDPTADVLVRVYLNEHDAELPVAKAPGHEKFYRWADLRAYLASIAYPEK